MATLLQFRPDVLTKRATDKGDLTNYAIAIRTGLRECTISRLLAGRTTPSLSTLGAIAEAYETTLDDLVGRVTRAANVPAQRTEAAA